MDLSSSMSSTSSSVKESSKMSSSKMSSSSVSSSSISSKSSLTAAVSDISSEMDELLAAATGGLSLTSKTGSALRNIDSDLDDMLSGTSLSSIGKSSTNSSNVSSSSSKQVSKMSSISQSSMEMMEGTGIDSTCKSSVKETSSSLASTASMVSESKMVDGQLVKAETLAEKASIASQGQKEKVVQDGQVLVDTGSKSETTSAARLMATKQMSQAEIDSFFQNDPAIKDKPVEALNYDKDKNTFEITLADLPEFSPRELTVKIVRDVITVYGTHEEVIDEDGKVTSKIHTYVRRFTVPKGLDNNVEWKLNADGALAIQAGDTVKGGVSQVHLDCTIYKPRSFFKKK